MAKKKVISGTRSCWIWIIIGLTIAVVLVFGVLIFVVGPTIQGQLEASQHYAACTAFLGSGDCDQAVAECEAVVRLDAFLYYPDATTLLAQAKECQKEMHYQRGLSFMSLEEWQKALDEFQVVLDIDPTYEEMQAKYQEVKAQMALAGVTPAPSPVPAGATPTDTPVPPPPAATDTPTPTYTPTARPTPTGTPPPTDTPAPPDTPTSTPPPGPISVSGLTIIYQEDFSDPQSGWERCCWWTGEVEYINGEMVVKDVSGPGEPPSYARPHLSFDNFVLEVDSRWSGGAVGGTYGLWFRYQDKENYYAFYIGNDGRYTIGKEANDKWSVLLEGFSDAINREGDLNRFHIEANGHDLRFFMNGQFLYSVRDVDHDLGDILLIARRPKGADFFEASFDNVIVAKHP
ncbi:MAG: hypothetical protein ACETWR_21345 [Anaerolineae bacterium]